MTPLIKKYTDQKRWVSWKLQTREGKATKIPLSITGRLASSTNKNTWSTYADIKKVYEKTGIVLHDKKLLVLDIDNCLLEGKLEHEQKEIIADFILEADSYTEISQSGKGLHIFIALAEPLDLIKNKHSPFEIYVSGRYIAVTGNCYGEPKEVRTISPEEAEKLLAIIGYPFQEKQLSTFPESIVNQLSTSPDSTLLERMFASKNGDKIRTLYSGDTSAYKNDDSSADMAFLSHLAFWTGRNADQMERLWLGSPLGAREKTQKRKDYRTRTINEATSNCKEIYEPVSLKLVKENPNLDLLFTINSHKDVVFTQNTENMCRILRKHADFQTRLRYDKFKNIVELFVDNEWRDMEDNDVVNIQTQISILFSCFGKVGKDMIFDACMKVSKEQQFDSAIDYVSKLQWDKTPRIDTWLHTVYGTPDNAYHRAVGSNWLKGLIKRIVYAGCKFDYVLVLEGAQGSKKSMSLSILGGKEIGGKNWHVETTMSTENKDFFMQFQGKAIIEFSEGETFSRTEVKRMKAIITMQSDKYRPAYGRLSVDFPRRCVFAMTTNQEEYLKDETGNRRWLPVKVLNEEADVEWLIANRDQLYAEAYYRLVNLKEKVYEFPKEETLAEQNKRQTHDENEDLIVEWYENKLTIAQRNEGLTANQVYRDCLRGGFVGGKPFDKYQEMKIVNILKHVLRLVNRRVMVDKARATRWFPHLSDIKDGQEIISTRELTTEERVGKEVREW